MLLSVAQWMLDKSRGNNLDNVAKGAKKYLLQIKICLLISCKEIVNFYSFFF